MIQKKNQNIQMIINKYNYYFFCVYFIIIIYYKMNREVLYYILLVGLSSMGIITNSVSFNPIRFHCSNYVLNTYLYFLLSWGIVLATVASLYINQVALSSLFASQSTIILAVFSILLLIGLLFTPASNFFTKHALYLILMVLFGVFLYPFYYKHKTMFNHISATTLIIFIGLTLLSFLKPDLIKDSWGYYLFIALVGILIARIVEVGIAYLKPEWYDPKFNKNISYVSILVFILYTLYDTKQILVNSKNCVNPDYINESLGIFLDSINLLQNIDNVMN